VLPTSQEHILAMFSGILTLIFRAFPRFGQVTKVKSADCFLGDSVTCGEAVGSWQDAHLVALTARHFENHVISNHEFSASEVWKISRLEHL
jgi:hypothetical protein